MSSLYYNEGEASTVERVVLAEDIELPELMKYPKDKSERLTYDFIKKMVGGKWYKFREQEYTDVTGKFYTQILTPTLSKTLGEPELKDAPAIRAATKGSELKTKEYKTGNFVELVIPKYIVLNFKKLIPAGTEFLVAAVGGSLNVEKFRIIGIYSYAEGYTSGEE